MEMGNREIAAQGLPVGLDTWTRMGKENELPLQYRAERAARYASARLIVSCLGRYHSPEWVPAASRSGCGSTKLILER